MLILLGVNRSFGKHLKDLRAAKGLTQEALAQRLGHRRPSVVLSWEKARRQPRPDSRKRLADALGYEVSVFDPVFLTPDEEQVLALLATAPPGANLVGDFAALIEQVRRDEKMQSEPHDDAAATQARRKGSRGRRRDRRASDE